MRTGYFARAGINAASFVHVVGDLAGKPDVPLCRYRPAKSMRFQQCTNGVYLPYIECAGCVRRLIRVSKIYNDPARMRPEVWAKVRLNDD